MRKKIAIGFLLLANIVLLAHTVLPHHHHSDGTVCFFVNSCNKDISHDKDSHHHNRCEDCSLVNNVFISQQTGQDHLKYELPSPLLLFIIPYNIDLSQNISFSFKYVPFLTSLYFSAILRTCVSRAPPVALS